MAEGKKKSVKEKFVRFSITFVCFEESAETIEEEILETLDNIDTAHMIFSDVVKQEPTRKPKSYEDDGRVNGIE
jgi:hypothetical protein